MASFRGKSWKSPSAHFSQAVGRPPALPAAGDAADSRSSCSITSATQAWRTCYTRPNRSGKVLAGLALADGLCRTRPTHPNSQARPPGAFPRTGQSHLLDEINPTWSRRDCLPGVEPSWTPASSRLRRPPRTGPGSRPGDASDEEGEPVAAGMKAHIGVDSETGIVHSLSTTAANVHDVTEAHGLLHGGSWWTTEDAGVDDGYQGVHKREENLGRGVDLIGRWRCVRRNAGNSSLRVRKRWRSGTRPRLGQPGAPFPESEAGVWLRQGALPGTGEEHGASGAAFLAWATC